MNQLATLPLIFFLTLSASVAYAYSAQNEPTATIQITNTDYDGSATNPTLYVDADVHGIGSDPNAVIIWPKRAACGKLKNYIYETYCSTLGLKTKVINCKVQKKSISQKTYLVRDFFNQTQLRTYNVWDYSLSMTTLCK